MASQKPLLNLPGWAPGDEKCEEPSSEKKSSGWDKEYEKPSRKHFNWLFKSISAFVGWFAADEDEYYVDANNGNDSNSGAQSAPLKTVVAALSKVRPARKTTIWLKSEQVHQINSDVFLSFPHIAFERWGTSETVILTFSSYISGGAYNAIYGIEAENPYIRVGSNVIVFIAPVAHQSLPFHNIYRSCFRVKGNGHVRFDGCYVDVDDSTSGYGKASVVGCYEGCHVSVAVANLPNNAMSLNGKGYVLDLGGIPATGGSPLCHACGSLSIDSASINKIDNPNCWVVGRKDGSLVREKWGIYFDQRATSGTFQLGFGASGSSYSKIVTGNIAYNASEATIETAIESAFSSAGFTVTAEVDALYVSGGIAALTVSLNMDSVMVNDGTMPSVWVDLADTGGATKAVCMPMVAAKQRKDINFVCNVEI